VQKQQEKDFFGVKNKKIKNIENAGISVLRLGLETLGNTGF
jgi:hypothetical protein